MTNTVVRHRTSSKAMGAYNLCVLLFFVFSLLLGRLEAQTQAPGKAEASVHGHSYRLSNREISADWIMDNGPLSNLTITDRRHGNPLFVPKPFAVLLKDGSIDTPSNLRAVGEPTMRVLAPQPE